LRYIPHDIVRIKDEKSLRSISQTFKTSITLLTRFEVLISGVDMNTYRGKETGIVIRIFGGEVSYPYVWDESRFSIMVSKGKRN